MINCDDKTRAWLKKSLRSIEVDNAGQTTFIGGKCKAKDFRTG